MAFSFASRCVVLTVFASLGSQANSQAIDKTRHGVEARVIHAVDERELVRLKGNIHRLANAQFDQGIAPASLAMDRLQLVLRRSAQQQT